jgi:hypothetical protein
MELPNLLRWILGPQKKRPGVLRLEELDVGTVFVTSSPATGVWFQEPNSISKHYHWRVVRKRGCYVDVAAMSNDEEAVVAGHTPVRIISDAKSLLLKA